MVLTVIPEFSALCMQALDAFESINTCKGVVFEGLNCDESAWYSDSRDEGVEVEAEFGKRACVQEEEAPLRQIEEAPLKPEEPILDTISVSSSINPAIIRSADHTQQRRHIKLDSFTTFLPYDDDEIFRSRQASLGSDSKCFRLCRLSRCTAFSQDSIGDTSSTCNVHPLKRDPPSSGESTDVYMVHWDELVEEPLVNTRILA
jgi:hypothetical protein